MRSWMATCFFAGVLSCLWTVPTYALTDTQIQKVYENNTSIMKSKRTDEDMLEAYRRPEGRIDSDNPQIVALAKKLTADMTKDYDKLKAINKWVTENIYYDYILLASDPAVRKHEKITTTGSNFSYDVYYDQTYDDAYTASIVLKNKRSVCSGYANLTAALLRAANVPAKYVLGYALGATSDEDVFVKGGESNHAWNEVYIDGRWVILDTTWNSKNIYDKGNFSEKEPSQKYFDIDLIEFSKNHRITDYDEFDVNKLQISGGRLLRHKASHGGDVKYNPTVDIPSFVTSIEDDAFIDCNKITTVKIPASVKSIGDKAFCGCEGLTTLNIADGVKTIGNSAFSGCVKLESIVIPKSVTSLGFSAFQNCKSAKEIILPTGLTKIDYGMFSGCESLRKLTIPDAVTEFAPGALGGCKSLSEITINEGNDKYTTWDGVVYNKDKTVMVAYPPARTDAEYIVPAGVMTVADGAFRSCAYLERILFPASVKEVGGGAFSGCVKLKSMSLPEGITDISGMFNSCVGLTDITLPSTVEILGEGSFSGCVSLTKIVIPTGATSITNFAFSSCSNLTDIYVPRSVELMGSHTFSGSPNVTIHGFKDSYAEKYASRFHIPFKADM